LRRCTGEKRLRKNQIGRARRGNREFPSQGKSQGIFPGQKIFRCETRINTGEAKFTTESAGKEQGIRVVAIATAAPRMCSFRAPDTSRAATGPASSTHGFLLPRTQSRRKRFSYLEGRNSRSRRA